MQSNIIDIDKSAVIFSALVLKFLKEVGNDISKFDDEQMGIFKRSKK
jgi:hypothetical protein